ncbi:MAG: DUF454 domain-containing protein [Chloroflexi bacterium]|nr:DUF454 domain-containing protein [Chloroflexota bacterium]
MAVDSRGVERRGAARALLMFIGTLSLALGIAGVFLPLLPTTPFVLLAAACYARSSRRFYGWLLTNRLFGRYVRGYIELRGVPKKVKVVSLLALWVTIGCSAALAVDALWARALLAFIAAAVTVHILSLRTVK